MAGLPRHCPNVPKKYCATNNQVTLRFSLSAQSQANVNKNIQLNQVDKMLLTMFLGVLSKSKLYTRALNFWKVVLWI
tara:strand:- start:237 stop:467 length:231 start_codon:yes stop_codon:yes gene_type:complete